MVTTRVTSSGDGDDADEMVEFSDDYRVFCDGSAQITGIQVHACKDGTLTHVVTIKGCRDRRRQSPSFCAEHGWNAHEDGAE